MDTLPKFVDMAKSLTDAEKEASSMMPLADVNKYPYGLCISLSQHELDKLNVDHSDWEVGAVFHLHALAKVSSISSNETESGEHCNVSLQITHLAGESEDAENENAEEDEMEEEPSLKKHGYLRYK